MNVDIETKTLLGINISMVNRQQLLSRIKWLASRKKTALVNNVNIHACNLAYEQPEFRKVLNQSDVVFCDGYGVKLGAALCGIKLGQRMTPPDWIDELFLLCANEGYKVYFIGDTADVVDAFARKVRDRFPSLSMAGWHHGFFDVAGDENKSIIAEIKNTDTNIVITGMGMPRQELWAKDAMQYLEQEVFIATGALFRWYTGIERRAPKWITAMGLEWLARLVVSPRRHFRRYIIGIPVFYMRVIGAHWFRIRRAGRG